MPKSKTPDQLDSRTLCSMIGVKYNKKGNLVKKKSIQPQKYQCWKCEGEGMTEIQIISPNSKQGSPCCVCNSKGYIELIPYVE